MPENYMLFTEPTGLVQGCGDCGPASLNNLSAVLLNDPQFLQLYRHPAVKKLWDCYQGMLWVHSKLQKDSLELKEEIRELMIRRELQEQIDKHLSERLLDCPLNTNLGVSRAPSLSPSDSISQAGRSRTPSMNSVAQPFSQPILANRNSINRPLHYPSSILWHLHDCQRESGLVTRATKSRPSMERCIRHPNGQPIVRYEWRRIMTSAKQVIQGVLRPLSPADTPLNTRTFYKSMHPDAWQRAIVSLEAQEPLVALCAFHWKAEHVLGQMLVSKRSVEVRVAQYKESQKRSTNGEVNNVSGHSVEGR